MGIPYYFYILTHKYKNILSTNISINPEIYCIDFNGIIHPVAQEIIKKNELSNDLLEEEIYKALLEKVNNYIKTFKPKQILICVDGVAPIAKIIQQRKRRYLTVYRNKIDNTEIKWDTNAISPGTKFMKKLNIYMKNAFRYNTEKVIITYSGSDENGEGEHKIFEKIKKENDETIIIINGLDADLIILSLISHKKNIYLMRENTNTKSTEYLNIRELREAILKELTIKWELREILIENEKDIIESYCIMCSLLGNDFIPHLITLDIKTDGLDKLINATKEAIKMHGLLVKENEINYKCITEIFIQLEKNENKDIYTNIEKYINKKVYNSQLKSDYYGLKNKDILANKIYTDLDKWRYLYYKEIFNTNISLNSSTLINICDNYIKGIYWTYNYYKRINMDHTWYYPYSNAPSIKDLSNHTMANKEPEIISKGTFISNNMQLLIILPKQSKDLLEDNYKKYMEDIKYGLYHLYPDTYKINTFLKTHLWECSLYLPTINIDYITKILSK